MPRTCWAVVGVVAIIVAVIPALRDIARLQIGAWLPHRAPARAEAFYEGFAEGFFGLDYATPEGYGDRWSRHSSPRYERAAITLAERRSESDPDLLTAAARSADSLATAKGWLGKKADEQVLLVEAMSMRLRAAQQGNSSMRWAAYVAALFSSHVRCERIGALGADPGDAASIEAAQRSIAESARNYAGEQVSPRQRLAEVRNLLDSLGHWQEVDPRNALPVALEAWVLYSAHRDAEALQRLRDASALPLVTDRGPEEAQAIGTLLQAVGVPAYEAALSSQGAAMALTFSSQLRQLARVGVFEGRRAQIAGRPRDAVALWQAVVDLGRHAARTARSSMEHLVGVAVEGVGADPVWQWCSDRLTGIPEGPLMGGRLFYGREHDLYVAQMGQRASEQLRDALIADKVRASVMREYLGRVEAGSLKKMYLVGYLSLVSQLMMAQLVVFLAILAAASWRRRRVASPPAIAGSGALVVAVSALVMSSILWAVIAGVLFPDRRAVPGFPLSFVVLPGMVVLLASVLASLREKGRAGGFLSRWMASIRGVTFPLLALLAISYLAVVSGVAGLRSHLTRQMRSSEMTRIRAWAGTRWDAPRIPADSWRPQLPPARQSG